MSASLIAFKPQPEEDASVDPRSGAPMLHVEALRVHYRQRVIVDRLSLPPLRAGEILGLVGPNAAGKSTLLRALASLPCCANGLKPWTGKACWANRGESRFVWLGAEFATFQHLRNWARETLKLEKREQLMVAYWRNGLSEHEFKQRA